MGTNAVGDGKISTIDGRLSEAEEAAAADIEKAISTTGYGAFNALLLLAALPIAWTGVFDTTVIAFVLASAECDLELDSPRKGVLAAGPFLGMALGGFLRDHLTPHVGTRNLFVLGLLADSVLNLLATAVDSFHAFLALKILSGILAGGPFSMVIAYLSEFHSARYQTRFVRWAGLAANAGIVGPAVLAFLILPRPISIEVFARRYPAWRIYLLACSLVPVLGLLAATALPPSPKHLAETGRAEEALALLRTMYSVNRWQPASSFPIEAVRASPDPARRRSFLRTTADRLRLACSEAKLLLAAPHLRAIAFLALLQFGTMLGFGTMRLWVPHAFTVIANFDEASWTEDRRPTMREMLDRRASLPAREYLACPNFASICLTWEIKAAVYQNSAIIASSTVLFSFLFGWIVGTGLAKRATASGSLLLAVASSFGMNWARHPPYMLTLASVVIVATRIAGNAIAGMTADAIPPPLRSRSLNLLDFVGNVAAVLGNVLFPILTEVEGPVAFVAMGVLFLACFCLSLFPARPARSSGKDAAIAIAIAAKTTTTTTTTTTREDRRGSNSCSVSL